VGHVRECLEGAGLEAAAAADGATTEGADSAEWAVNVDEKNVVVGKECGATNRFLQQMGVSVLRQARARAARFAGSHSAPPIPH
jgi:hypothetical protein